MVIGAVFLLCCLCFLNVVRSELVVTFDSDHSYHVYFNQVLYFTSATTKFVRVNNQVITNIQPPLAVSTIGQDSKFGVYDLMTFTYQINTTTSSVVWINWFKQYQNYSDMFIFGQTWPQGANGTLGTTDPGSGTTLEPIAGFPSFLYNATSITQQLDWTTWSMYQMNIVQGHGLSADTFARAYSLSTAPHVFVDPSRATMILSPLDNFQPSGCTDTHYNNETFWSCGILNSIPSLPAGFSSSYIIYTGQGVTDTFYKFGQFMQEYYNFKKKIDDLKLTKLGYYTDNGAYYAIEQWSNPAFDYNTFSPLFIKMLNQLKQDGIPVSYFSLDGFWFVNNFCPPNSTARSDLFPDGLKNFSESIGMPLDLYAVGFCQNYEHFSGIPTFKTWADLYFPMPSYSLEFYTKLFTDWYNTQNMRMYEIDFMDSLYLGSDVFFGTLDGSKMLLEGMSKAAEAVGVPIQYCGTFGKQVLETLQFPGVTNVRVGNDYDCWNNFYMVSNILPWAVGLASSKDTFWTTPNQPNPQNVGCQYVEFGNRTHNNSNAVLHTVLAALTDGPVAFSDAIGYTDKNVILPTCTQDGTLLRASKTITLIDTLYTSYGPVGFGSCVHDPSTPCTPTIYQTHSVINVQPALPNNEPYVFYYVVSIAVQKYAFSNVDLWPQINPKLGFLNREWYTQCQNGSVAVGSCVVNGSVPIVETGVPFVDDSQKQLKSYFYVISPIHPSGWVLLGEASKYVSVSPTRITLIDFENGGAMNVKIVGTANESVTMTAVNPKGLVVVQSVVVSNDGTAVIAFQN